MVKKRVYCPYTLVYNILKDVQNDKKSIPLSIAHKCIRTTPGLLFLSGTTSLKVLKCLEKWELIQIKDKIVVIK